MFSALSYISYMYLIQPNNEDAPNSHNVITLTGLVSLLKTRELNTNHMAYCKRTLTINIINRKLKEQS